MFSSPVIFKCSMHCMIIYSGNNLNFSQNIFQVHNADQLADWCLYYIAISYNEICRKNLKLLRNLHPENQAYLNRNRWPPIWYVRQLMHCVVMCQAEGIVLNDYL